MATEVSVKPEPTDESLESHTEQTRTLRSFGTSFSRRFQYRDTIAQDPEPCLKVDPDYPPPRAPTPRKRSQPDSPRSVSPRNKRSAGYAPPSRYAHLDKLQDKLEPNLICVFIGNNPGVMTAEKGHAYAHPSNLFWKLLYSSGCTNRRCRPEEDGDMPRLYSMGFTNIVERPTRNISELAATEMINGTPILEAKIRQYRPEAVCIVGKGIWESIYRHRYGRKLPKGEFEYGWQEDEQFNMGVAEDNDPAGPWPGAKVFVASSTSGLAASTSPAEKTELWGRFGAWVSERRAERAEQAAQSMTVKTEPEVTDELYEH